MALFPQTLLFNHRRGQVKNGIGYSPIFKYQLPYSSSILLLLDYKLL